MVARAGSEGEARALIAERRRAFHDARHTCSAFLIGPNREIARSNDDKEPAGTAGMPMLEALSHFQDALDLTDAVAVVTRWFGGVLLGKGGLTRAYSDAVTSTLQRTRFVRRELMREHTVTLDYAVAGRMENSIRDGGMAVTATEHTADGIVLTLAATAAEPPEAFARRIAEVTGGAGRIENIHLRWVDRA